MDSITQIALGASIGEIIGGKEGRNKALFWGGVAGLIPDLDVFTRPLYTQTEYLLAHRGISHSAFFAILLSPLFALALSKLHKKLSFKRWLAIIFLGLFTHPILDIMTTYGTGFLEPFSSARLAIGNINIVDPIYSLPLIFTLLVTAIMRHWINLRKIVIGAFIFSHIYLTFTLFNYFYMQNIFKTNLKQQNISYDKIYVTPTLLNNILWYGAVISNDKVYLGLYSHFDSDKKITFTKQQRNLHLSENVNRDDLNNLKRFSKGFYLLTEKDGSIIFHDLRFGFLSKDNYSFNFNFSNPEQTPFGREGSVDKEMFSKFIDRVFGDETAL